MVLIAGVPQLRQKRSLDARALPHLVQALVSGLPQLGQKRSAGLVSVPHRVQRIYCLPLLVVSRTTQPIILGGDIMERSDAGAPVISGS